MRLQLGENARMALKHVRENKVRSVLTIIGVVIGVTTLITVASILVGLDEDMRGFLDDFGPDTLFVFKFDPGLHFGRLTNEERMRKPLTLDDALALKEQCPAVKEVVSEVFPRFVGGPQPVNTARYKGHEIANVDYSGALPTYEQVYNVRMDRGRYLSDPDNNHASDVVVIGHDLGTTFFPNEDPLGKVITVNGIAYSVIGVEQPHKGNFFKDESADRAARVPYKTYQKQHPAADENFVGVLPYPGRKEEAMDEIREVLRRRRHVPFDKPDNFGISSADAIAVQFHQVTGAVALLTVVISSIGLLVGGVGVMNIMLMSVTERTREIGVRKAIGARRRDIIWQFLTEAITLTGLGGIIGVLIGFTISEIINMAMPALPSAVPLWSVFIGVLVSMSIGLFFGMYPAVKAARLDPVEALRYE